MENLQPDSVASISTVSPAKPQLQRTEWAEHAVEEFLALPFFSEFVYRDVRTNEGRKQEQVADFLILHRGTGLLIEQKCQEATRTGQKESLWARKKAREGWRQIRRAFTRRREFPVWCNHPRLGQVTFPSGLPPIRHAIVVVEVFQPVDLSSTADELPLDYDGLRITYISLNDFLNLTVMLRSIPELDDYLSARRALSPRDLRNLGSEKALFSFYLLNDGSFTGCFGIDDARLSVAAQEDQVRDAFERKFEADRYAHLLEHVADQLATRHPNYAEGVPESLKKAFDPVTQRRNYVEMQSALADLRLRERSELGQAFHGAMERVARKDNGFIFRTARFDSMPDWVFIVASSKNIDRPDVLNRALTLMKGAMAFYEKPKCLVLVDRDGASYEVALSRPGTRTTKEDFEIGRRFFGDLRVTSSPLHFLPCR
jgi:hypothetical protein